MKTVKQSNQHERQVLAVRESRPINQRVIYRLEAGQGFWITAQTDEETDTAFIGQDLQQAWEIFGAVVRGGVTPCTLREVCEDRLYEASAVQNG